MIYMKIGIHKICLLFLFSFALLACEKEEDRVILQEARAPELSVSVTTAELHREQAEEEALAFSWTEAEFGFPAAVNYTLQLAQGGTDFAEPRDADAGSNLQRSYTVEEINNIATQMGLEPDAEGQIEARVRAELADAVEPVYSNVVSVNVTPYQDVIEYPALYVPGAHQGWNPAEAPRIVSVEDNNIYEGYVYFPEPNTEFKFTSAPNWDETNYGSGAVEGTLDPDGGAPNLVVEEAGYYRLQANTEDLIWSATRTEWGVIGDATAQGWDADQDMSFDPEAEVWRATLNLSAGELKFRANDAWDINLGDDGADGTLEYNGANIAVEEEGEYEVILDLSTPGNYTYSLEKL
jgi:hypothetical protein